jgi:hypothetical protein
MFARIKKSGKYEYLQIVKNRRDGGKPRQHVIATVGRMDRLQVKGDVENLIRSLSRFSDKVLLVLSERGQPHASAKKIGPSLICERLWQEFGIKSVLDELLTFRKYKFDVERAIFLTVLHRLFVSGSDRSCHRWHRDYRIDGVDAIRLHHLYRAMAFLGEQIDEHDQEDETPYLSPRCIKDRIEEQLFFRRRDLFSGLDFVFFDTTSIYFEGDGGNSLGQKGYSKDHRPDLNQMVVGVILDNNGNPICCEMWPGNTADVTTVIPVTDRIRKPIVITERRKNSREFWLAIRLSMKGINFVPSRIITTRKITAFIMAVPNTGKPTWKLFSWGKMIIIGTTAKS